jgi:hypothetical protein
MSIAILAAIGVFAWSRRDDLAVLDSAPIRDLVLIGVLILVAHGLNATEFWVLYRGAGITSGVGENWLLFGASQLGNHLPGQVGTIYKLRYMKVVHEAGYAASAAVYGANLLLTLLAAAIAGGAGALAHGDGDGRPALLAGFALLAMLTVVIALVPLPRSTRTGRVARAWSSFHESWERLRREPVAALVVLALELAKLVLTAWRMQAAFGLLDLDESFWFFLVLAPAASVAGFLSFTPAALGIRELFVAGSAAALGTTLESGLLGATIDRALMLVVALGFGALGYVATVPRLRRAASGEAPPSPALTAETT